ncbi:hypothetical protein FZEAL_6228 [Fusarium zealandicum]|uniref:Uncharacterized protein n=1 Tax=Fusarium zealandicum TaxID=1053134 RepID=A0A8H4XJN9_9HYPO|nr:hypothetical protein FZEAL_6228 [Fusarium zealandicum]
MSVPSTPEIDKFIAERGFATMQELMEARVKECQDLEARCKSLRREREESKANEQEIPSHELGDEAEDGDVADSQRKGKAKKKRKKKGKGKMIAKE